MPVVSQNLQHLVNCEDLARELDLGGLAQALMAAVPSERDVLSNLMGNPSGEMRVATLLSHLDLIASSDSAVRDVLTSGHLGKLLARWDVFLRTRDHRIIAMPNELLDQLSQRERAQYFASGASLDIDGDAIESQEARTMLEHEHRILANRKGVRP